MKALDFPLLADENVHPDVILFLREAGLDVESVSEQGQFGLPDSHVLQQATEVGRVVLTQDGVDAWFDKAKLLPGQDWELEIRKVVRKSIICA